jgi:hypothetical protein
MILVGIGSLILVYAAIQWVRFFYYCIKIVYYRLFSTDYEYQAFLKKFNKNYGDIIRGHPE